MAASSSDLFRKVARRFVAQVGSGGVTDASTTTGPMSSVSGLPTDTGVDITFGRVDSSGNATPSVEETVTGVVSGSNLVTMTRGQEGTAQAHAAGVVAENLLNAITWNDLIDGLLVGHSQAGLHKFAKVVDGNDNETLNLCGVTSAVNEFTIFSGATGNGPSLCASGGDTNIDIRLVPKGSGEVDVVSGDLKIATGANIQVNNADPKRAFYIPASGMFGATTNGAASAQVESATNAVNFKVLDFDKDTDEYACFTVPAPLNWDLSTVTAQFFWTCIAGGSASETVKFYAQALAQSNDDTFDAAYGTAVGVEDALITLSDVHVSAATSAITVGGTPAANDLLQFRVYRDVSEDTLAGDARLIGIRVEYGISKYNDIA